MQDFTKLNVWQKSHMLVLAIYKATEDFPPEERYGLTSQMRRSSASIPTNIAEGSGRSSQNEFAHFLTIAMGSASELEYQLILAHDLTYLDEAQYTQLNEDLIQVKRMLRRFTKSVQHTNNQ